MTRTPVVLESPYAGDTIANIAYLQRCIQDSIDQGEAPFASHQMYTMALDNTSDYQRLIGIECGYTWLRLAQLQVFYTDRGWSPGMIEAWRAGAALDMPYRIRALDGPPRPLEGDVSRFYP
jgi:hypothetical protein